MMKQQKKIKCENCESAFVYVRRDGSVVCRRCGYIKKEKKMKNMDINQGGVLADETN